MDELWAALLFENDMVDEFITIHPREMIMSKNIPAVDTRIRLTVPTIISTNSWLTEEQVYLENTNFDYSAVPTVTLT